MNDVIQLCAHLSSMPLFGVTATLVVYTAATAVYERLAHAPWANPVLWSITVLGAVLAATRTPYAAYFAGAQLIHVLLGPATVALAWPLWLRKTALRKWGAELMISSLVGGAATVGTAVALGCMLDLPRDVVRSLATKAVTSPVAMGIAERIGGVPALAATFAIVAGIVGALSARHLFNFLGIKSWAVRGFALGTTSHGIGVARALQIQPDAGAYASIALGLQVLLASFLLPLAYAPWP